MQLRVGCTWEYTSAYPTPATMLVQPHHLVLPQIIHERWETGGLPLHAFEDIYGNRCQRFVFPVGDTTLRYHALIEIANTPDDVDEHARQLPIEELPDDVLLYTLPSRYCLSDALMSAAWELFGTTEPGYPRVQAVCDWIHNEITYGHEFESTPLTTAVDIYEARAGICRDFAHLGVTFCRALNIPARYCFGYMPDISLPPPYPTMDFHAWFEVYLSGRWWTRDARFNYPCIGRTVIGRGRDAVDVALITSYGPARFKSMTVVADPEGAEATAMMAANAANAEAQ